MNMNEIDNKGGDQEWNVQCDPKNVRESDQEVQCDQDQSENIQCVQTECVMEGECQEDIQVICEKEIQRDQIGDDVKNINKYRVIIWKLQDVMRK